MFTVLWSPFGCPQQRRRNPSAQGMALYVGEGFRAFWQSQLECSCHESSMFRICSRINSFIFMLFIVTQRAIVHFITVSLTLWVEYSQFIINQSFSLLVMRMLITLISWNRSILLIDRGIMLYIFAIWRVVRSWFAVPLTLLLVDSILWWRMPLT